MARKGPGWHDESRRHSLARRGIKTATDNHELERRYVAQGQKFYSQVFASYILKIVDALDRGRRRVIIPWKFRKQIYDIVRNNMDVLDLKYVSERSRLTGKFVIEGNNGRVVEIIPRMLNDVDMAQSLSESMKSHLFNPGLKERHNEILKRLR